jgi:serine/threonine protein kinase
MTATATSIQAGFEPIPGYVLRERLGAGGYGDVWLADAPGGLKKAIKFVHGNIDEDRASNELKSLQRIRQVHHPFILSLERIEIIHGQLIIVTELAQCSLHDRFLDFRAKGFVGITRDRLLAYLRDAADGLDFLCQQHDLQHLDVKPANLLLVADRVKVADFGLIKDIQSNSLSMMGGLTPTYAAPEMFDGRPGRFSDQYSLAIVYQEMLTGTLPFRGRTTAQLANEHLNKAPNLEAIPLLERPVMSKALAKKPQLRFSDCREFINALERASQQAPESSAAAPNEQRIKPRPASDSRRKVLPKSSLSASDPVKRFRVRPESTGHTINPTPNLQRATRQVEVLPALCELESQAGTATGVPVAADSKRLIIGIGQTGAESLLSYRRRILDNDQVLDHQETRKFLLIDTDQMTISQSLERDRDERLGYQSVLHIPLKSPQYYRESTAYPQISRRWVYNIPRSLKTEGVRPLGMLAFLDNAATVLDSIQDSILALAGSKGNDCFDEPIKVQIVGSSHGGTGSALFSEVGFMVRQVAAEFELAIQVELVMTCATPNGVASTDLATASALSCLMEINHYFRTEGLHPPIEHLPPSHAVNQPPFDRVQLIYGGQCGSVSDWNTAVGQIADYLWAINETELGPRLIKTWDADSDAHKDVADLEWSPWLSTVGTRQVECNTNVEPEVVASRICLKAGLPWISAITSLMEDRRSDEPGSESTDAKSLEQMDFFVSDMFRSNQWTAQAWVHQCMLCLMPDQTEESIAQEETQSDARLSSSLVNEEKKELQIICEQLALESHVADRLVTNLIDTTRLKLSDWILQKWMTGPSSIANLRLLLRLVSSKFGVNANSLRIVAEKLSEKHDSQLEKLYSGEIKSSPDIDNQLHAMALESRFHSMASRMLYRLAEHMGYLEDLWVNECVQWNKDLCTWGKELSHFLDIPWDGSSRSQTALANLVRSEQDDSLTRKARKALLDLASQRFKAVVKPTNETKEVASESCKTLVDVFEQLMTSVKQSVQNVSPAKQTATIATETEPGVAPAITEVTFKGLSSTGNTRTRTDVDSRRKNGNLLHDIEAARPYFVEFGGALRMAMVLPAVLESQLDPAIKEELTQKQVGLVVCDSCKLSSIIAMGEHLVLHDIMERVWMPSSDIWQLAHRVVSRVDVEWIRDSE